MSLPNAWESYFPRLQQLIREYKPDQAAIETVFVANNAASAIKLGQARGAAVCAAISCDLPVAEYSPRSVKQAIVGRGGADKAQVQHMVGYVAGHQGARSRTTRRTRWLWHCVTNTHHRPGPYGDDAAGLDR